MAKKRIIAIDDSPEQLQSFKLFLGGDYDFRAAAAASGALSFLKTNEVDLVLLDIEMPNVDGFEFLKDIKRIPSHMSVPVIIVSGNKDGAFLEKARNSAAVDVLTKPVTKDTLIAAIEKALAAATSQ